MKLIVKKILNNPFIIIRTIVLKLSPLIKSDKTYLKLIYFLSTKERLNLNNPQNFTQKLQWMKLFYRNPIMTQCVDKFSVREFVQKKIGETYLIPLLGIYTNFNEINFDKLPNEFVLKTTHDSGGIVICKNKFSFNKKKAKKKLTSHLNYNFYLKSREYPYKNVPHRIIAEKYMKQDDSQDLIDYKFFCFDGNVKYCQVIRNRSTNETIDFFDRNWTRQDFIGLNKYATHANPAPKKPEKYEEMITIAEKLSSDFIFCRIDLYFINKQIYFGEITFFPSSGIGEFSPKIWNQRIGNLINLPIK